MTTDNIAYGTYHLKYLLERYDGRLLPAIEMACGAISTRFWVLLLW